MPIVGNAATDHFFQCTTDVVRGLIGTGVAIDHLPALPVGAIAKLALSLLAALIWLGML